MVAFGAIASVTTLFFLDLRPVLSSGGKHRNSRAFFCSLINSLCGYDPIGMGLPYNYLLVPGTSRENLAELCGQLMTLMLDYEPPTENPVRNKRNVRGGASLV